MAAVNQPASFRPTILPSRREPSPLLCVPGLQCQDSRAPGRPPAQAQKWEQPPARPGPSTGAGMLASPPARPGALTGVAPAPGASARGGPTRRRPPALTHGGPGGAGLPASREGPWAGGALGRRGCRLLRPAARAEELCQKGVGGSAGASLVLARGGAAWAGKEGGEGALSQQPESEADSDTGWASAGGGWEARDPGEGLESQECADGRGQLSLAAREGPPSRVLGLKPGFGCSWGGATCWAGVWATPPRGPSCRHNLRTEA